MINLMEKTWLKILMVYSLLFLVVIPSYAAITYDWTGATSTAWNDNTNWSVSGVAASAYPGQSVATDIVQIGVSATSITVMPILSLTLTKSIASLTFGSNNGPLSLTINSGVTLTVSGALTVNTSSTLNLTNTGTLSIGPYSNNGTTTFGAGTVNISGDFNNIAGTTSFSTGPVTITGAFTNSSGNTTFGTGLVTFNSTTGTNANPTLIRTAASSPVTFINLAFVNTSGNKEHFQFKSLTGIGNSAVFYLASTGIFKVGTNTIINVANSIFYFLSDATGSASIDNIPSNSNITGTFYVQRYITGNSSNTYRGYRLLSSPVNITSAGSPTISLAYLNADFTVGTTTYHGAFTAGPTGTAGGFSITNGNPTVYLYKESLPVSNAYFVSGKHVGIYAITNNTVTTVSNATGPVVFASVSIPVGNGYRLYYVGPNTRTDGSTSLTPDNATMTASGNLNQGDLPVTLWYAPAGGTSGQLSYNSALTLAQGGPGFNMVGNPYACTIDLSKVMSDNTGIDNIYTLDPTGPTQAYAAYTKTGNSAPNPPYAISGSGFIVHASGTGKTLTFHESEKVATQVLTGVLMGKPTNEPALTGLYMKLEQDSIHHSYCGIYFRGDWSDNFKPGDAIDINDYSALDISSLSADGFHAAVNHRSDYTKGSRIRLYVNASTGGAYTLKIEGIRNIDTLHDIWLVDHYKNDSLNIRRLGSYAFNIVKSDTASYGINRFVLAIRLNPAYAYQLLDFTAHRIAHSPHVELDWKTKYEQNYINFTAERSTDGGTTFTVVGGLAATGAGNYSLTDKSPLNGQNLYRLKQQDMAGTITYSQVVTVEYDDPFAGKKIHIFPNPASHTINLAIAGQSDDDATYCIRFVNSSGIVVKQITSRESKWESNISYLQPGTYLVRVINNKTQDLVGENKFVKL
jgi:hypothetical protein